VGVRLAIGATRTDIVSLFIRGGAMLGVLGILIGTPLALVVARGLSDADMLFQVSPWDATVWLTLPCALIAAVLLATTQPAFRASRVDPSDALRP
jgi:putative ABC transport system permease protein